MKSDLLKDLRLDSYLICQVMFVDLKLINEPTFIDKRENLPQIFLISTVQRSIITNGKSNLKLSSG